MDESNNVQEDPEDSELEDESTANNADMEEDSESSSEWEDEEKDTTIVSSNESTSEDETTDKCSICLHRLKDQEVGTPDECDHRFCCVCIKEWAQTAQTCPIDRKKFSSIIVSLSDGTITRVDELYQRPWCSLPVLSNDVTSCEVCGLSDREDRLLLCDNCDLAFHLECLEPPLETVPYDDWFCPGCLLQTEEIPPPPTIRFAAKIPESAVATTLLTRRIRQRRKKARRKTGTGRKRKSTAKKTSTKATSSKQKSKPKCCRRKVRKVRKSKKKRPRLAIQEKPTTSRARIAHQLGIVPAKRGHVYFGMPECRVSAQPSTSAAAMDSLNHQRFRAGISTLRIYSHHDDLADCIENESDEDMDSIATIRPQAHRRNIHTSSKFAIPIGMSFGDSGFSSGPNILSEIMNSQQTLLHDRNIRIGKDGVLIPSLELPNSLQIHHWNRNTDTNMQFSSTINDLPNGFERPPQRDRASILIVPNSRIRQTPLGNSESSGNFSQFKKSSNSVCADNGEGGSSRTEEGNGISNVSPFRGNDNTGFDRSSTSGDLNSEHLILTPNRSPEQNINRDKPAKEKNKTPDLDQADEDDDYNIYSDIEEERERDVDCEETTGPGFTISSQFGSEQYCEKLQDSDNENDMIIDEDDSRGIISSEREKRNSTESHEGRENQNMTQSSNQMNSHELQIESEDSDSLGMPAADSPESIPLPDSTPPPSVPMPPVHDEYDLDEIHGGSVLYSPSDDDEVRRQEYDPSQPLTSSDEEDHSNKQLQASAPPTVSVLETQNPKEGKDDCDWASSGSEADALDLSSIPIPADEYRRPTIQFSIPTRHKLIPISSLIKRQKGVVKKESSVGSAINYQSEVSKAFGVDKDDGTMDGGNGLEETDGGSQIDQRMSLVAEIFGSDDEEELKASNTEDENIGRLALLGQNSIILPNNSVTEDSLETTAIVQQNKWKRVAVESSPEPEPTNLTSSSNLNFMLPLSDKEDEAPSVNESTTAQCQELNDAEVTVLKKIDRSEEKSRKNAASFLELISDDTDDEITIISPPKQKQRSRPEIIILSPEKPLPASTTKTIRKGRTTIPAKDRSSGKNNIDKPSGKERDERNSRIQKRRRSNSSLSNYEEGEIPSDKRRKRGKKSKKIKKRRKSKDSHSSPRLGFGERQAADPRQGPNSSSEADEDGDKVPWKKPSKSSKDRNYRDGKPKTEEKFFREKEKGEARDRLEKQMNREKSPHHKGKAAEKDRKISKVDSRRTHRRSVSKQKSVSKSPIRWSRSRSRSISRSRFNVKRTKSNRSRSISSRRSFSPRHSAHSRSPRSKRSSHYMHTASNRKDRSRTRSPAWPRSRSPVDRHRNKRRSRSNNRGRINQGRSGRAHSSSASRSGSRSRTKKKLEKADGIDKVKKTSTKKDKEKVTKEIASNTPPQDEVKEKEKKKKKRRKEKSVSPAKAVFADGDSIVVSLNFQKTKELPTKEPDTAEINKTDEQPAIERKKKRNSGRDSTSSGKVKPLKKTILIDLETSPVQEKKIGDSPALVVLSDDEEDAGLSHLSSRTKGKDGYQAEKDHDSVTTTGGIDGIDESTFQHGKGVQADSTQIHQSDQMLKMNESAFGHTSGGEENINSPTRGDSIVTSTRDSIEGIIPNDEDNGSRSNSPKPPESLSMRIDSPIATTPLLSPQLSRQMDNSTKNDNFRSTPTSIPSQLSSNTFSVATLPSLLSNSGQGLVRPLGIGSIPGLFPSTNLSTTGIPVPPPVVIPTPPPAQLRFSTNINPSINILASVASALYGPLMAVRQGQPFSKSVGITSSNNLRPMTQGNILLPKNQNSHSQPRRTGDGDSPFSPNSSEGDDLFEPPLEKRNSQSHKDGPGSSGNSIGHKSDKNDRLITPNPPNISSASSSKPKTKSALFDTLFGSPKKTSSTSIAHQPKTHGKVIKSKSHNSSNAKKGSSKKDPHQLSEGELRQTEDVTSAVELRVKEKFLKKLNRQERVVEEVKLALKPHYGKKSINKDEYKEILRRAVPKVCHNKSGEINPFKIKELVEAYVKKFKHSRGKV